MSIADQWKRYLVPLEPVNGFPYAERRVQHGTRDEGDMTGTPYLTFEVKNRNKYAIRQWPKEAKVEKANAIAD